MAFREITAAENNAPEVSRPETHVPEAAETPRKSELQAFRNTETPSEVTASGQELAEAAHEQTKSHMLEAYGGVMSETHRAELESSETLNRLTVMSDEDYEDAFPDVDHNVLGHCDHEGNIYMKGSSEAKISHISTHETMHVCADREAIIFPDGHETITGGLHEIEVAPDGTIVRDSSRGINEGTTELYTLRELNSRGETEAANSVNAYSESRMWAQRLETLVGGERLEGAYFGGDRETLKQEFIRLNDGDTEAWERFSRNVDTVEYSGNALEVERAQRELANQYISMLLNRDVIGREVEA